MIASLVIGGVVLLAMIGVSCYGVISAATTHDPAKAASAVYIFPVVMCVLLVVQVGTIKVARGRSGMIG